MWNDGNDTVNGKRMSPNVAQQKNIRKITIEINDLLITFIVKPQSFQTGKIPICQL